MGHNFELSKYNSLLALKTSPIQHLVVTSCGCELTGVLTSMDHVHVWETRKKGLHASRNVGTVAVATSVASCVSSEYLSKHSARAVGDVY